MASAFIVLVVRGGPNTRQFDGGVCLPDDVVVIAAFHV